MSEVVARGHGEFEVVADQAEIVVSYSANAADRSRAVSVLGERTAAVDAALEAHGDGVQVRHRSVHVHTQWKRDRPVGCTAARHLTIRISRLEAVDGVLGDLLAAEPEWLNGPSWRLADESAATGEAQRRAVADARTRAEAYAAALGGRLGALVRLADDAAQHPGPFMATMEAGAARGDFVAEAVRQLGLSPELVTVRADCVGTWSLDF